MLKRNLKKWMRPAALLCAVLLLFAFSACSQIGDIVSGVTAAGEFPVTVDDVTVSSKPQRVVVLSPSLADVILALGYETQLAAGSDGCTQDSLRSLTKINGGDAQAIIDLNPDLVLAGPLDSGLASALENANLTVLELSPATGREDFERLYGKVATVLAGGTGYDAGIRTAQGIFTTMDDINRVVPKDKVTTACYLYDLDGSAVTGDMFGSTIMSYAGVTNVFQSLDGGQYEFGSLRVSNPTAIFCVPGLKAEILADSRFDEFQAVQNDMIFELEPSMMEWQGRTIISAAFEISADCFPELLEENSMVVTDPTEEIEAEVSSALSTPEPSSVPTPASYETLQQGDASEEVLAMQERLDELGYMELDYDGYYGEYTAGRVQEFQRTNGLEETGVADEATLRALFSADAKPAEDDGE